MIPSPSLSGHATSPVATTGGAEAVVDTVDDVPPGKFKVVVVPTVRVVTEP